ncbi:MAG TPA: helix-turn-helix domain-containing protein [Ferruginibacter sp.]|nr:helix-turn-helix domain-containing protein [Ferruginibacter sp.]
MNESLLQKQLFTFIKEAMPSNLSLVDKLTELLDLSNDSVYRRLRGETPLTLDELKILCEHFQLSLDQVLQLKTDKVLFTDPETNGVQTNFLSYLQRMLQQMQGFARFKEKEMLYQSKDVPIFHFFLFKEISSFKSFFWRKSILKEPEYEGKNFSIMKYEEKDSFELGLQILKTYNEIPSTELWNYESITSTLMQIEYYRDSGVFETKEDLNKVVESCEQMLNHLEKQLEAGYKFLPGTGEAGYKAPIKFYVNEIILGNNSILINLDGYKLAFINHIVLKYIYTADKLFTNKVFNNFYALTSRSALISGTGERERTIFFKKMKERLLLCKG